MFERLMHLMDEGKHIPGRNYPVNWKFRKKHYKVLLNTFPGREFFRR